MIAAMVFTNLLYVVGAVIAATCLSAFIVFRHRRPKSLEAGIEMFSRELKALQPDRHGTLSGVAGIGTVEPDAAGQASSAPVAGGAPVIAAAPPAGQADGGESQHAGGVAPFGGPGGRVVPGARRTRNVNLRPAGAGNLGYSPSRDATAPSSEVGNQPG